MSNLTFGLTLLVVGMGGTLITLYVLTLLLGALTKIFPAPGKKNDPKSQP